MSSIVSVVAPQKRLNSMTGTQKIQSSPAYRSPIAISPGSSDSPPNSAASPPETTRRIVTLKEWVLPPRPKPGRKPCLDTPASKRKAQNRAAQRAFRERRATRVQELEEQLAQVEKEHSNRESHLSDTVNRLLKENSSLKSGMDLLKLEMLAIRLMLLVGQVNHSTDTTSPFLHAQLSSSTDHTSFQASMLTSSSAQQLSPESSEKSVSPSTLRKGSFDCGYCAKDDCSCAQVGLKEDTSVARRRHFSSFTGFQVEAAFADLEYTQIKPMPAVPLNRKRKLADRADSLFDEGIVDFTKLFVLTSKPKPMPTFKKASVVSLPPTSSSTSIGFDECSPVENCGFCSDDTPCVCREAAQEAARLNVTLQDLASDEHDAVESRTLPPIKVDVSANRKSSLPVLHPGPSVEIREIANLPTGSALGSSNSNGSLQPTTPQPVDSESKPSGCTGNPGQCTQCQADPMSTLFCTTVASRARESAVRPSISRTGLRTSLSSMLNMPPDSPAQSSLPTGPSNVPSTTLGIFINCADAYKTLSRHEKFKLADFSSLVGKLTTRGMQVEVQSVANVLRELDRRLYH